MGRSRLARLILNVNRLVCKRLGIPAPDRLCRVPVPECQEAGFGMVLETCNRLTDAVKTMAQPSEPLDQRWRAGWTVLIAELTTLERQLELVAEHP